MRPLPGFLAILALAVAVPGTAHAAPRSETTATLLTLLGIATPFALTYLTYEPDTDNPMYAVLGGTTAMVLPELGHWYTGRVGTYGMLIRVGALTSTMVGVSFLDDARRCDRGEQVPDGCAPSNRSIGRVAIGLGLATWAGSWVYDVFSARREVRRDNEHSSLQILPMATRHTTGLAIGGSF